MRKEYKLELTIVVDEAARQSLIDVARRYYAASGGEGTAIDTIPAALLELVESHPAFEEAGVLVQSISCTADAIEEDFLDEFPDPDPLVTESYELDSFDTGAYLCRWPNGDVSVVTAATRRDAIVALDEWGGADASQVHPIDTFMADFSLNEEGELVLANLGEETREVLWDTCYPVLRDVLNSDEVTDIDGNLTADGVERIRAAVEAEKTRLLENQPAEEPATELGRRIAGQLGTSAVVADRYAEEAIKHILESDRGEKGKPN